MSTLTVTTMHLGRNKSVSVIPYRVPYIDQYMRYHSQLRFQETTFSCATKNADLLSQPFGEYEVSRSIDGTKLFESLKSRQVKKACVPTDNDDVTVISVPNDLGHDVSTLLRGTWQPVNK